MLILSVIVGALCIVQLFVFARFAKVNKNIDKLFNESLRHESELNDHRNRLESDYNDIARCNMRINLTNEDMCSLSEKISSQAQVVAVDEDVEQPKQAEVELNERRAKFAEYRKQGMDYKSAGKAVGVSFTTAKRYEKWMADNKK